MLIVFFLFGLSQVQGQTEAIVNFRVSEKVVKTKGFRFSIHLPKDTISVFNYRDKSESTKNTVTIPSGNNNVLAVFEYSADFKQWHKIKYPITLDKNLKRIEITINYSSNDRKVEFLQELTVYKYYTPKQVYLQSSFKIQIGERPSFKIVNKSNQTFRGNSWTKHFYGSIKEKKDDGWQEFRGLCCIMSEHEKSLGRNDSVYSWVPHYHSRDEYRIKNSGTYTYTVIMTPEDDSDGILMQYIDEAKPTLRTKIRYELESTFVVK